MAVYNGTSGGDFYFGTATADTIYGNGGPDNLLGGDGADAIYGGDGNDNILDFDGQNPDLYADTLNAGAGDDYIYGGYLDNIDGSSGLDRLILRLDYAPTGIVFDFTALWSGATYTLAGATIRGMERLQWATGSAFSDILTSGTPSTQTAQLSGLGGGDQLTGGAGTDYLDAHSAVGSYAGVYDTDYDVLYGLGGNDILSCGIGDYVDGGTGTDRLNIDLITSGTGVTIDFSTLLASGSDTILGTPLISIEDIGIVMGTNSDDAIYAYADATATTLVGRDGNDLLVTGNGDDVLDGGSGADTMVGGAGNDEYRVDNLGDTINETSGGGTDTVVASISWTLGTNLERLTLSSSSGAINGTGNSLANLIDGNNAANIVSGGDGDDYLNPLDGDDVLIGGTGRDDLVGGAGADRYVFDDGDFSGTSWGLADRIYGFSAAQGDRIDLSQVDAIAGGADDTFSFIGSAAFGGVAGQLRYDNVGGVTTIYGDVNGDGVADFAIALNSAVTMTATDFIL